MTTFTAGLFFLYPENYDFVAGKTRNLAGQPSYYRTVFPWLIVMLVFCGGISMTRRWINWYQLQSAGVDTMATIVDRRYTENDDSKKYYITYQFEVVQAGSSELYTHEEQVDEDVYQDLSEGTRVLVRYIAENPRIATIKDNSIWSLIIQTLILLTMILFALVSGHGVWKRSREIYYLQRHGRLIEGELIECKSERDSDNDLVITLRYHFLSPTSGQEIVNKSSTVRNDLTESTLPPPGTPVAILYADDQHYRVL